MKTIGEILNRLDERFTETDVIGVGRWWDDRAAPGQVKQFLRRELTEVLEELKNEMDKFPKDYRGGRVETGYFYAVAKLKEKIDKIIGSKKGE